MVVRIVLSITDEYTLARQELSAAHAALDSLGVPRYGKTDAPLPLALRIQLESRAAVRRVLDQPNRHGLPPGQMSVDDCIAEVERES